MMLRCLEEKEEEEVGGSGRRLVAVAALSLAVPGSLVAEAGEIGRERKRTSGVLRVGVEAVGAEPEREPAQATHAAEEAAANAAADEATTKKAEKDGAAANRDASTRLAIPPSGAARSPWPALALR